MALAHQSIATINSPQFINLTPLDINPLMSSCEIKVFYLGQNRNGSYISKEVATEMAKTLRGAPIVGYFKPEKEDFADHGQQMIWDDEGIHFNVLTKPYGFVSPDAQVWFKDFQDKDDFGNTIVRTYMMTTGYLWTGQFEQAQVALKDGRPQSMELDEKSLKGKWAKNIKEDMQFFIINDAIFSKLCILGNDVEPCFQGAAVTAPEVSKTFSLDDNFKRTLFGMMEELQSALKGGNKVAKIENELATDQKVLENQETPSNFTVAEQDKKDEFALNENEVTVEDNPESTFVDKKEEEDSEEDKEDNKEKEESDSDDDKDDEEEKKKYAALEVKYNELQTEFTALEEEVKTLREFKENVQNVQKDALINEFYMLSDEDKKDVIENKSKYTLDEIKSKLAVICFEKKVNFNLKDSAENEDKQEEKPIITFNVDNREDSIPDWVKEVESVMNE